MPEVLKQISDGATSVWNYFTALEAAPNLEEKIDVKKQLDLIAYSFERVLAAISDDFVQSDIEAYLIQVSVLSLNDPTQQLLLTFKRERALDGQKQHVYLMLQATLDKTNIQERILTVAGIGSIPLQFGAPHIVKLGSFLPFAVTQNPAYQKQASKMIARFVPNAPSFAQQFAATKGAFYEGVQGVHSSMGQTKHSEADAKSGQRQDDKQNQETHYRMFNSAIEKFAQINEQVQRNTAAPAA